MPNDRSRSVHSQLKTDRAHAAGGPHYTTRVSEAVVAEVLQDLDETSVGLPYIAVLISQDPALRVRVLHHINSAVHALPESVTSVRRAVALLGADRLRKLLHELRPMGSAATADYSDGIS